jgi:hypothetical protein
MPVTDPGTFAFLTTAQKEAQNAAPQTPSAVLSQNTTKTAPAPAPLAIQSNPISTQSTTALSSNKDADILNIQNTTKNLSNSGINTSFDPSGNPITTYANNTPYTPGAKNDAIAPNTNGVSNGGYVGETYYPVGSTLPKDSTGNYSSVTPYSPTDVQSINSLNDLKTKADALTASTIDNITKQYETLIKNQQRVNEGFTASTKMGLIRSGALKGDVYSNSSIQSAMDYGTSQIADLQTKMQTAIIAAQAAGQDQDYKLMNQMNQVATDAQKSMREVAGKMQEQIAEQNKKLAEAQLKINDQKGQGSKRQRYQRSLHFRTD